jgi:uncharacterized protein
MIDDAVRDGRGAVTDAASAWLAFLASPTAPQRSMSLLELDGYLTGVIVAPSLIRPSRWMAGLWIDEAPAFNDAVQAQLVLSAVGVMFNALSARIERSLRRLEAARVCDYRPAFQADEGKPLHDIVRRWASGFWRAMELAPADWHALAADDRTQVLITPFVGFIDAGRDAAFQPAADIDDRLDEAAEEIPRAILLLRKIAQMRASRPNPVHQTSRPKTGRNDPCPCGSGKKFKRCCGQS